MGSAAACEDRPDRNSTASIANPAPFLGTVKAPVAPDEPAEPIHSSRISAPLFSRTRIGTDARMGFPESSRTRAVQVVRSPGFRADAVRSSLMMAAGRTAYRREGWQRRASRTDTTLLRWV